MNKSSIKKRDLTKGPIGSQLIKMSIPMLIGLLATMSFSLVDAYFVGALGSSYQEALTFIFGIDLLLTKVIIGFGIAAVAFVGPFIGKDDIEGVRKVSASAFSFLILFVLFISILGFLTIRPLFSLFSKDVLVLNAIESYMRIWYCGIFTLAIPMFFNFIIRATGDAMRPGIIMLVGTIINIILDPLLIHGLLFFPKFGIAGAAMATLIGRSVSMILSITLILKLGLLPKFSLKTYISNTRLVKFAQIAITSGASQAIQPLAFLIGLSFFQSFGLMYAAGYGPAARMEAFFLVPLMALSSMFGPFVAQNLGVNNYLRITDGFNKVMKYCVVWGIFSSISLIMLSFFTGELFNDNQLAINNFRITLMISPIAIAFVGISGVAMQFLNTIKKPHVALTVNIIQYFGLLIPIAYLTTIYGNFTMIIVVFALINIIGAMMMLFFAKKSLRAL